MTWLTVNIKTIGRSYHQDNCKNNVESILIQRHDVESKSIQCCFNAKYLLVYTGMLNKYFLFYSALECLGVTCQQITHYTMISLSVPRSEIQQNDKTVLHQFAHTEKELFLYFQHDKQLNYNSSENGISAL